MLQLDKRQQTRRARAAVRGVINGLERLLADRRTRISSVEMAGENELVDVSSELLMRTVPTGHQTMSIRIETFRAPKS